MAVKFIVDSAADVCPNEAEIMGVVHIPLTVIFGDTEYRDAVDLSHFEFYEKLIESDTMPSTCQVPPAMFEDEFAKLSANGDSVVVITVSSKLSGTYQSAVIAAEGYSNVYVVDSENVSVGERILLQLGVRLRDIGYSAQEIAETLNIEKKKIRLMALLDTLEYLKKGGRISATAAIAGAVLGIKPVVTLEEGAIEVIGKARGSKQGNNLLRELIMKCGGIDFTKPLCLAYSGLSDKMLQKYIVDSSELWKGNIEELPIATVGSVIGTHAGPGAIAIAFFGN